MEVISKSTTTQNNLSYLGKGATFAFVFFKNTLFTILSLGLYYPWAKTEILKYHYNSTQLDGKPFEFTGTGLQVFKSFAKIYLIFFALYSYLIFAENSENQANFIIALFLLYTIILLLIPFAIHGAIKYRAHNTKWNQLTLLYDGIRMEFFRLFVKGFFLTIVTFGVYTSWFQVAIRKYILQHLKFGNITFDFKAKGETLFWIQIKMFFFGVLTFGIYSFWYYQNLFSFYVNHTKAYQEGNEINFKVHSTPIEIAKLLIVNSILIVFTLGIAYPWTQIRIYRFIYRNIEFSENANIDSLKLSSTEDYNNALGDSFLDFLDLDLI